MHNPLLALVSVSLLATACNRRVFERVEPACGRTIVADIEEPTQRAADILIVVDSSGSMAEEQENLADNFVNLRAGECPLLDLKNIDPRFQNPAPALYEGDGELSKCGFIQLLAAFNNDFRVGVITTDVSPCDNRIGQTADHGFHPQRGCLQPDSNSRAGALVLGRADLFDERDDNDDLASRFRATLQNIGTSGSGFERGLDAMQIFLDPRSERAPECVDDLSTFRREGAQLVVIFLSDEEDCSHADGAFGFDDENVDLICGDNDLAARLQEPGGLQDPGRCYQGTGLAALDRYSQALRTSDPRAKVAVIAGLVQDPQAEATAIGCRPGTVGGQPLVDCWESRGSSNANGNGRPEVVGDGSICSDDPNPADARTVERAGRPCCSADPAQRYVDFARSVDGDDNGLSFRLDSICATSFRSTMIDIAVFIASTNLIVLVEPPADDLIIVTSVRAGESEEEVVPRITKGDCELEDGFYLEGLEVVLCNDSIPAPGDQIHVRAKGSSDKAVCEAADSFAD